MGDITVKEMIKSAKKNLDEVSVADVKKKLNSSKTNIIDLRDTAELIENGVIPGSHHASRGHLEFFADPKCKYYKDCFNKEKEIISEQINDNTKDKRILDKIIEGKINKFYNEVVLLEQNFIIDNKLKVSEYIERLEKELGSEIIVKDFIRFKIGEDLE